MEPSGTHLLVKRTRIKTKTNLEKYVMTMINNSKKLLLRK